MNFLMDFVVEALGSFQKISNENVCWKDFLMT